MQGQIKYSSIGQPVRLPTLDLNMKLEIDSLLQKVNLDSAFLNLAKNDSELVTEMKKAI